MPNATPQILQLPAQNWQTYRVESYYKLAVTNKPLLREVLLNIEQLHNTKNTFQKLTYPKSKILYVCCQLTPPSCAAEGGRMDGLVSSAAPPQGQMVIGDWCSKLEAIHFCFLQQPSVFCFLTLIAGQCTCSLRYCKQCQC